MRKIVRGMKRDKNNSTICSFGYLDYMILASTLAIALGEELSQNELGVLASFFAVLSDELALISSLEACNSDTPDEDTFVAPVPAVATTLLEDTDLDFKRSSSSQKKKKVIRKKIKKRKRR